MASPAGCHHPAVEEAKGLIAELCASLYSQGHVSGTGGGISIKVPTPEGDRIVMAPSGVQKERMWAADMFVLDGATGAVLHTPEERPPPYQPPKLSECAPLFMSAFELRGAGAVLHGHSMNALLATLLDPAADELRLTHVEMIKGIAGQVGVGCVGEGVCLRGCPPTSPHCRGFCISGGRRRGVGVHLCDVASDTAACPPPHPASSPPLAPHRRASTACTRCPSSKTRRASAS